MHKISINNETFSVPDGTLLSNALIQAKKQLPHTCGGRGSCKKCSVYVNGVSVLSCQYKINSDITVELPSDGDRISIETDTSKSDSPMTDCCLVLDIGTTTLVLALVSLTEKKVIKSISATNPQNTFGADIFSRIDWCTKNGVHDLNAILITKLNEMTEKLGTREIGKMYVSGNTTMLHLFFGVDCSSMGIYPYKPTFLESKEALGCELGLEGIGKVISLPCISSFVGADLVAGVNFTQHTTKHNYNLLIDLGTNAEIVLYGSNSLLCTSAAAGPCFEGANICCGMSATDGAIYTYFSDGSFETVNNQPPKGICGTGLIDITAELLKKQIIDSTGYMQCGEFYITDSVKLTQKDIRQLQLAKSAVYSGITALLNKKSISFSDIETLFISGGFSTKINVDNAIKIGLIPKELKEKSVAVNNSCLLGTVKYACENNDLNFHLNNCEYVELSSDPSFTDMFINNTDF